MRYEFCYFYYIHVYFIIPSSCSILNTELKHISQEHNRTVNQMLNKIKLFQLENNESL